MQIRRGAAQPGIEAALRACETTRTGLVALESSGSGRGGIVEPQSGRLLLTAQTGDHQVDVDFFLRTEREVEPSLIRGQFFRDACEAEQRLTGLAVQADVAQRYPFGRKLGRQIGPALRVSCRGLRKCRRNRRENASECPRKRAGRRWFLTLSLQ